jgi:hypothetical protein
MYDQASDELIFTVNTGDSHEFSESEHDNTDSEYSISLFIMIKLFLQYFVVTQSRTGLQIYEGRDDQLNRPGPMA